MMVVSKTIDIDISSYTHMVVVLHTVRVIVIHYVNYRADTMFYTVIVLIFNNCQEMYSFFTLHSP